MRRSSHTLIATVVVSLAGAIGRAPFCAPRARLLQGCLEKRSRPRPRAALEGDAQSATEDFPFRRAREPALPKIGAPVQPVRELRDNTVLHKVLPGGQIAEESTYARSLWSHGLLLVAVRRPGCWMSREQARAVSEAYAEVVDYAEGKPRLVAIVRSSIFNEDGTSEVEAFREYFPGDVFVDDYLSVFKALGDRQYTDGVYSEELGEWMLQRMVGTKSGRRVPGNFVGGPDVALKYGGVMLMDSSGKLRYTHQEGIGKIDYKAIKQVLSEM